MSTHDVGSDPWDAWAEPAAASSAQPCLQFDAWGNPEPVWSLAPALPDEALFETDAWAEN